MGIAPSPISTYESAYTHLLCQTDVKNNTKNYAKSKQKAKTVIAVNICDRGGSGIERGARAVDETAPKPSRTCRDKTRRVGPCVSRSRPTQTLPCDLASPVRQLH